MLDKITLDTTQLNSIFFFSSGCWFKPPPQRPEARGGGIKIASFFGPAALTPDLPPIQSGSNSIYSFNSMGSLFAISFWGGGEGGGHGTPENRVLATEWCTQTEFQVLYSPTRILIHHESILLVPFRRCPPFFTALFAKLPNLVP